jgi:hypothetical protein
VVAGGSCGPAYTVSGAAALPGGPPLSTPAVAMLAWLIRGGGLG